MKKKFAYTTVFIILSFELFSQPFKLSDTSVKVGQFQYLYDIHFELGSANLQSSGLVQLDSVFQFLVNNPTTKIELGVHTDFRGDDNMNLELSKKRATTLKKYLVEKGINADRINAIGFGETKPIIKYEDWKEIMDKHRCGYYGRGNRRVSIVVVST
jgi:outer membrane protein OmpA-like peptidoglycan-associated protein